MFNTFNRSRLSRLAAGFLASVISASMVIAPISAYAADGDEVVRGDVCFADMTYSGTTKADFDKITATLRELIMTPGNEDEVSDTIDAIDDLANVYMADYGLAKLHSSLDCKNQEYIELAQTYSAEWTEIADVINSTWYDVAVSDYADILHEKVDDDDWQDILDYKPLTDEQKELIARETELCLYYDEIYDKEYTATIDGEDYTLDGLEEALSDGTIAWHDYCASVGDILKQNNQEKGEIYVELVGIRKRLAEIDGESSYAEYAYREIYDREYLPSDLDDFRTNVRNNYTEVYTEVRDEILKKRRDEFLALSEENSVSANDCIEIVGTYTSKISPIFEESLSYMQEYELCDISVDSRKAAGAFTAAIGGLYNEPYICIDSSESYLDVSSFAHEFGHFNAMYYAPYEFWYEDKRCLDVDEIQSQGLVMLLEEYNEDIYGEYADGMALFNAYDGATNIVEGCLYDEFQLAAFEEEDLTVERLNEIFYELSVSYGIAEYENSYVLSHRDLADIPKDQLYEWVDVPHSYSSPFYYISYAVSRSAVQELMLMEEKDRQQAIDAYLYIVTEGGGGIPFSEVLEGAGVNNPIDNPRFDECAQVALVRCGLRDDTSSSTFQNNIPSVYRSTYPVRQNYNNNSYEKPTDNIGLNVLFAIIVFFGIIFFRNISLFKKNMSVEDDNIYFDSPRNYRTNSNYNSSSRTSSSSYFDNVHNKISTTANNASKANTTSVANTTSKANATNVVNTPATTSDIKPKIDLGPTHSQSSQMPGTIKHEESNDKLVGATSAFSPATTGTGATASTATISAATTSDIKTKIDLGPTHSQSSQMPGTIKHEESNDKLVGATSAFSPATTSTGAMGTATTGTGATASTATTSAAMTSDIKTKIDLGPTHSQSSQMPGTIKREESNDKLVGATSAFSPVTASTAATSTDAMGTSATVSTATTASTATMDSGATASTATTSAAMTSDIKTKIDLGPTHSQSSQMPGTIKQEESNDKLVGATSAFSTATTSTDATASTNLEAGSSLYETLKANNSPSIDAININMPINTDANTKTDINQALDNSQDKAGDVSVSDVMKQISQMSSMVLNNKIEINSNHTRVAPPSKTDENKD